MNIQRTNQLFEDGTLAEMYKAGFVSTTIFRYREIYLWVDAQIKTRQISTNQAAMEAEVKFAVSRGTIYTALKKFK